MSRREGERGWGEGRKGECGRREKGWRGKDTPWTPLHPPPHLIEHTLLFIGLIWLGLVLLIDCISCQTGCSVTHKANRLKKTEERKPILLKNMIYIIFLLHQIEFNCYFCDTSFISIPFYFLKKWTPRKNC